MSKGATSPSADYDTAKAESRAKKDLDHLISHIQGCSQIQKSSSHLNRGSLSIFRVMEQITIADDLMEELSTKVEELNLENLSLKA